MRIFALLRHALLYRCTVVIVCLLFLSACGASVSSTSPNGTAATPQTSVSDRQDLLTMPPIGNATWYCQITGQKQGIFKAEAKQGTAGLSNPILMVTMIFDTHQVHDPNTGVVASKREHSPVAMVKAMGPASIQFAEAIENKEVLTNISCAFVKPGSNDGGADIVTYRIQLDNAVLDDYRQFTGRATGASIDSPYEELSIIYQKLTFIDVANNLKLTIDY
jgi:type VI secretion system Hcp family effector